MMKNGQEVACIRWEATSKPLRVAAISVSGALQLWTCTNDGILQRVWGTELTEPGVGPIRPVSLGFSMMDTDGPKEICVFGMAGEM